MATANLFNREVRANKSPRNAFDMSYSTLFTSPCGMLLPSYVQEVKRGDKLKLGVTSLTRSAPVSTPAFMSFDEKTDFWFVPYRLIWSDYDNWRIGQTFRHRTTMLDGSGAQNYLPFSSFGSLAFFFDTFVSAPTSAFMIATPSSAIRYLDLLGYSVPNYENLSKIGVSVFNPGGSASDVHPLTILHKYYQGLSKSAPCNYFRLAAFQCIYMHCYRNEEYELLDPSYYNVDNLFNNFKYDNKVLSDPSSSTSESLPYVLSPNADTATTLGISTINWHKLLKPRYKNWRKDVFTAAKPNNGFASGTSGLQIGTVNGNTSTYGSGFYWPTQDRLRHFPTTGTISDNDSDRYNPTSKDNSVANAYDKNYIDWTYQTDGSSPANVVARLYTAISSNSAGSYGNTFLYPQNIRNLMAQDKFSRAAIYADKDISSQIKALFGENYNDPHTPVYLGSYSTNVSIDDVVATAAGDSGVPSGNATSVLGELAGQIKQADGDNKIFEHSFNDDGVVLGVHYVMPRNNYDSYRLNKWNTKISRFDYYYPQFDGLGYQPIIGYERFIDGNALIGSNPPEISTLYGFAPRYYEYKQRTNEVHSTFQNGQPDFSWTLTNNSIDANARTSASDVSYKILPDITNRMFNVAWDGSLQTDPFQHYYHYDATLVSDMEIYGTPSL